MKTSNIRAIKYRYEEIKHLYGKKYARNTLFKKLFTQILFNPNTLIKKIFSIFKKIDINKKESLHLTSNYQAKKRAKVFFIVGGFLKNGGGHRNILRIAYFLEIFGYKVTLGVAQIPYGDKKIGKLVRSIYPISGSIFRFNQDNKIYDTDFVIATHWETVKLAKNQFNPESKKIYLVQDLEHLFYPMGDKYIAAENTYKDGFFHLCSGPWCCKILKEKYNARGDYFEFPIDKSVYNNHSRDNNSSRNKLLFFAKPEMDRRCFRLGIDALEILKNQFPELEIVLFGSNHLSDFTFDFEVTNLGVMPTLEDMADLYKSADIGIVFSTTNPSIVPYEMMACGLVVVDLDWNDSITNYGNSDKYAILVKPEPEKIASRIASILSDKNSNEIEIRQKNSLEFVERLPSEIETVKKIEKIISAL